MVYRLYSGYQLISRISEPSTVPSEKCFGTFQASGHVLLTLRKLTQGTWKSTVNLLGD